MPTYRVKRHAVIQPLDESYRLIPLTRNQNAIVDAEDFDWLMQWNWYAAWNKYTQSFYADRQEQEKHPRRRISMHRQILGCKENEEGDHENHDTLDNRRRNLRIATRSMNMRNRTITCRNVSGYKGVWWSTKRQRWIATLIVAKKRVFAKSFLSAEEAAKAWDEAAIKFHGAFACLNFPVKTEKKLLSLS